MALAKDGMKKCSNCGEVKPVGEFHPQPRNVDGLYYICKSCRKIKDHNRRHIRKYSTKGVCEILKQHAEVLEDDPERLSTDFIKSLMRTDPKC